MFSWDEDLQLLTTPLFIAKSIAYDLTDICFGRSSVDEDSRSFTGSPGGIIALRCTIITYTDYKPAARKKTICQRS